VSGAAIIDDLQARRLIQDHTDLEALRERLERGPLTLYVGFDPRPTASMSQPRAAPAAAALPARRPSAHRAGGRRDRHGRDPGGRSEERNLLDSETLDRNTRAIKAQLSAFLDFEPGPARRGWVDNRDWTAPLGVLDFLRDVGKHVTVNYMLARVRAQPRRERARHLVHRVQLHAATGQRLLVAAREHELRAAGGRIGSVGQHHRGHRSHPRRNGAAVHG